MSMVILLLLALLMSTDVQALSCPRLAADKSATLKYINDGDTITLENGRQVRLIGIDTPEINHADLTKSEPYALQARALLAKYLHPGDTLQLAYDRSRKDKYGRMLAYVYSKGGRNLGLMQLQQGFAQQMVVGKNDKLWRCFQRAERQARQRRRGLWRDVEILSASRVQSSDQGYVYLRGQITARQETDTGLKLLLNRRVVVLLSASKQSLFNNNGVRFMLHDKLDLRGKLSFSKGSPQIRLYHPVQILP